MLHDLKRFRAFLVPVRALVGVVTILTIAAPLLSAALLWIVKGIIDDVFIARHTAAFPGLAAVYLAGAMMKFGVDYVRQRLDLAVVERLVRDVRVAVHHRLLTLSPGSLGTGRPGDLLARLAGDVERVEALIYSSPLSAAADLAATVFYVTLLLALDWRLTLTALAVTPALVTVVARWSPPVRRAARAARRAASAWVAHAEESLNTAVVTQALGAEAREVARFADRVDASRRAELRTVALQARLSFGVEGVIVLGGVLVLAVSAWQIGRGATTLGTVIAFAGSVGSLYDPVRGLAKAASRFQRAAVGARRIAELLDARSLVADRDGAKPLGNVGGHVQFRDVAFRYTGGPLVLDALSFTIEPGQMVAIVGPSGGGKSTLLSLLLRLYDPTGGAVLVDGIDLRDATVASVRAAVAVVPQDATLRYGSIADNVRDGRPDATDEDVVIAAHAADVTGFAGRMPAGYDTPVGPRGSRLSGGQRQRVALARALVRDAPILLLDEATAAIDGETETHVHAALQRLAGTRTVLAVTHRVSTLRRAHRVLVLDGGRVVEDGTPAELLRLGTRCYSLFAAQIADEVGPRAMLALAHG